MDKLRTTTLKHKLGEAIWSAVLEIKHLLTAVGFKITIREADQENAAEQNLQVIDHTNK